MAAPRCAASGSAEVWAAADDEDVVCPSAPSAAADEALRVAMAAAQYEGLVGAIEEQKGPRVAHYEHERAVTVP